jgi:hypothetical protein
MADWGLYSALRYDDSFERRARAQESNMQALQQRSAIADKKAQEQMQIEQGLVEYFNKIQELDVTPEDAERIKEREAQERKNIVEGVKKYNGDLKKFMMSGGITALSNYKNNVMMSQEVQEGLQNKVMLTNYVEAKKRGDWLGSVEHDIPTGQFDDKGNEIVQRKKAKFEEWYQLYKDGKITTLPPIYAEKKANISMLDFSKQFKNPANPYSNDNIVTKSDVYNELIVNNVSQEQAYEIAEEYAQTVKQSGRPMYWGAKDIFELQLKQQALELKRQKLASQSAGGSGGAKFIDTEINALRSMSEQQTLDLGIGADEVWGQIFKATKNKDGTMKFHQPVYGYDALAKGQKFDLSKAKAVVPIAYYKGRDKDGNIRTYLKCKAVYEDKVGLFGGRKGEENTPLTTSLIGDTDLRDVSLINNWKTEDNNHWSGMVDIPIDNIINDQRMSQYITKGLNIKNNHFANAPYGTTDGYMQYTQETLQQFMDRTGASEEEAMLFMQQANEDPELD